jgi:hypothetical protein
VLFPSFYLVFAHDFRTPKSDAVAPLLSEVVSVRFSPPADSPTDLPTPRRPEVVPRGEAHPQRPPARPDAPRTHRSVLASSRGHGRVRLCTSVQEGRDPNLYKILASAPLVLLSVPYPSARGSIPTGRGQGHPFCIPCLSKLKKRVQLTEPEFSVFMVFCEKALGFILLITDSGPCNL